MSLIDLYVTEVGKRLPLKGRSDIEAELRSTLEDMLEDRAQKAGRPADEAMMLDLLKEYGPPDKVAATYNPYQYLIGPAMYPFFVRVLKIVLSVLSIVLLVTLGIKLGRQPLGGLELAQAIGTGLLGILGAGLQAFGNIALVFAILERVMPASEFKIDEEKKEWDPASLKKAAAPTEVKPWEPITNILFTVAAMVVLNGYSNVIAMYFFKDGAWQSVPVLTEAFFRWLPLMNVQWALQIVLNVILLRQGRWQTGTRVFSIATSLLGIFIGYMLLTGAPIVSLSTEALLASGAADAAQAQNINAVLQQAVRLGILMAILAQAADVVKNAVRLVLKSR
ncbi:MAG TPA: hypothetical protein VIU38_09510 [Anaerolineales bacterium]